MEAAALRNRVPRVRAPFFFAYVTAVVVAALAAVAVACRRGATWSPSSASTRPRSG